MSSSADPTAPTNPDGQGDPASNGVYVNGRPCEACVGSCMVGHVLEPPEDAVRLLTALFDPDDPVTVRPTEVWMENGKKQSRVVYAAVLHATAGQLCSSARLWARLLDAAQKEGANLFFGVCPRFGRGDGFDLAGQIRTVRALWADLDRCMPDEALRRCEAAGLPRPSAVVNSGNGVHLYWILEAPYHIDDVGDPLPVRKEFIDRGPGQKRLCRQYVQPPGGEKVYRRLTDTQTGGESNRPSPAFGELTVPGDKARHVQHVLAGLAAKIGGDHTQNLDRLLRLPGTLNRKDQRRGKEPMPCVLVELDAGRRHPFAVFEQLAEHAPDRIREREAAKVVLKAGRNLTPSRRNSLADLISACAVADDRSRADFRLLCRCVEQGIDKEQVWAEVQNVGKFAERGRDYFDLSWGKAEQRTRLRVYDRLSQREADRAKAKEHGVKPRAAASGRAQVLISPEEKAVNDAVAAELVKAPDLYQRGNLLAAVLMPPARRGAVSRPEGAPVIVQLPPARLREEMTGVVDFVRERRLPDGGVEIVPAHPPGWCVAAVHARGRWPGMRWLEAVIEAPTLRPDGTVLDRLGYDPDTGLLYEPQADFPPVPETPGLADGIEAANRLLELVAEFPFVRDAREAHQAAWLAALLTPFARFAVAGPCPLFLMDAGTPGTGKSLLCDVIAVLATGRKMARTAFPESDEELRKVITSVAIAGDRLVLFDNVTGEFGGAALDAALTGSTWKDRILGRSEMTAELPLVTVWFGTGNNVTLQGDARRRVLPCRMESEHERPEEREGFRIPRLLEHVAEHRPRLVADCLPVLRAYEAAGRPARGLSAFGSFDSWSDRVRSAVNWVRGVDPCDTRQGLQLSDSGASDLTALLQGWAELPGGAAGVTAAEALKAVRETQGQYEALREVFRGWVRGDGLPSARAVGRRMAAYRGRVASGRMLRGAPDRDGVMRWAVVEPSK